MDLAQSHLVAFPRESLVALRAALIRDTGVNFSTYLQEAGYAGGEPVFSAFEAWLATHGWAPAEALDAGRLTMITGDEEGVEKTDSCDIAIVPMWKWLLRNL